MKKAEKRLFCDKKLVCNEQNHYEMGRTMSKIVGKSAEMQN